MARTRKMSLDILRRSCTSPQVLEIVENISAWYDGSRQDLPLCGQQIPLGARMIAVVEAFDAMTTDHIYRPARSQERAMAELFECAGTQFDPELVQQFVEFRQADQTAIRWDVAHRWLRSLDPAWSIPIWDLNAVPPPELEPADRRALPGPLAGQHVRRRGVHRRGGPRRAVEPRGGTADGRGAAASVRGQIWHPELLHLSDEKGRTIGEADCPVQTAIRCGVQSLRRLTISGRGAAA